MRSLFFLLILSLQSCYSFKGISIPTEIEDYTIGQVELSAENAPSEITTIFSETLKDKIQKESRLRLVNQDYDLEINTTIVAYDITPVAAEEGSTTALNRLEIVIKFEYNNMVAPDDSWKKTYTDFEDFPSNQSVFDIQDELIMIIFEDMIDRIFNDAFANW